MRWALWSAVAMAAAACFPLRATTPPAREYRLAYAPPAAASGDPLPAVLRVLPFGMSPAYDRQAILVRRGDYRLQPLGNARWAARPADMVTDLLRRDLFASRRFRAVQASFGALSADYELSGQVDAIELVAASEPPSVRVQVTAQLVRRRGTAVLLARTWEEQETVSGRGAAAVAAAASSALARISERLRASVEEAVAADLASPAPARAGARG